MRKGAAAGWSGADSAVVRARKRATLRNLTALRGLGSSMPSGCLLVLPPLCLLSISVHCLGFLVFNIPVRFIVRIVSNYSSAIAPLIRCRYCGNHVPARYKWLITVPKDHALIRCQLHLSEVPGLWLHTISSEYPRQSQYYLG